MKLLVILFSLKLYTHINIFNKGITITNAFFKKKRKIKELNIKPNKIWVDKGCKFYNNEIMVRKKKTKRNEKTCIQCIMKENLLLL